MDFSCKKVKKEIMSLIYNYIISILTEKFKGYKIGFISKVEINKTNFPNCIGEPHNRWKFYIRNNPTSTSFHIIYVTDNTISNFNHLMLEELNIDINCKDTVYLYTNMSDKKIRLNKIKLLRNENIY